MALRIRRCPNLGCSRYHRLYRPEQEGRIVLPYHEYGLDVLALVGTFGSREHRSVPEIHRQRVDRGVFIGLRSVSSVLERYDELISLSVDPAERTQRLVRGGRAIVAIDGLQPEVGQEVLWVVREVLLARSLLSSAARELTALLREATMGLRVPGVGVISEGGLSVRKAVAEVFPEVPHQLCHFHYLRPAAGPIYEADRQAKKELKKAVRGVRPLERAVEGREDEEAPVVQGYCAEL